MRGSNFQLAKAFGLGAQPQLPMIVAVCPGGDKRVNLKYEYKGENGMKKTQVDKWFFNNFGTTKKMKETCVRLGREQIATQKKRQEKTGAALTLSKEALAKKRVGELRDICEDFDINITTLREKSDFVEAIFQFSNAGSKEL